MSFLQKSWLLLCLQLFAVALTSSALGQQLSAEELFNRGKAKVDARDFEGACPDFEASYLQSGIPGALLSWSDCEESRNRFLRAMELWEQALKRVQDDPERVTFVQQRMAALRPRIPRLKIVVARAALQGVTFFVDGKTTAIPAEGVPIDPGRHQVSGLAPGDERDDAQIDIAAGETKTVTLFTGTKAPPPDPPGPALPAPAASDDTMLIAGWVVGSAGLAGLLVFAGTGIAVVSECNAEPADDGGKKGCPDGYGGVLVANAVTLGVGGAALGVGVILLAIGYTQPGDAAPGPAKVVAGPGDAGMGVAVSF